MGETQDRPFQLSFNSSLKVDFQGSRVTSDGGLVLVRELDERLGLSELMERHLSDTRRGKNIQLPLADLLRQSIYSRLAGYEDVNRMPCRLHLRAEAGGLASSRGATDVIANGRDAQHRGISAIVRHHQTLRDAV